MAEGKPHRKWTAEQKLEIVLAGIKSGNIERTCREHEISSTLCYRWRDQLLEGGLQALAGKAERDGQVELERKIARLERALGKKTYELEVAGGLLRDWE